MAFALYLRYRQDCAQPEPPQILDKNIQDPNVRFTFVDFIPSVVKRSGKLIQQFQVEYHSFSAMIEVANQWLQNHGQQWQVVNCETIIILFKYHENTNYDLKPNDCCFYIYGSEKNNVLRALRLWIRRRVPLDKPINPPKICFKDYCPNYKKSVSEFENLDDVIRRINTDLATNGLEGRIISIESVPFDANLEWQIDTETSLSTLSTRNVFILRIFYEQPETEIIPLVKTFPQIGVQDFLPRQKSRATFFKRPRFETFNQMVEKGSNWLRKNPRKHFINAQSIDIKIKSHGPTNSRLMAFTEHGDYVRVFRITYVELDPTTSTSSSQSPSSSSSLPFQSPITLATRMFLPNRKSDTIADIAQRLHEWINQLIDKQQQQQKRLVTQEDPVEAPHSKINGDHNNDNSNDDDNNDHHHRPLSSLEYPADEMFLTAETLEVYAKDVRHDNRACFAKAANEDTFLANRFGNKNAYLFFSFNLFYDGSSTSSSSSSMSTSDSCTNVTMITNDDSSWSLNTLISAKDDDDQNGQEQEEEEQLFPHTSFDV